MEIVGGKWQTIIGIGCEGPWVACWFTLALLAYVFPNWRHLMIATMIPTIALSFLSFLLPESPKWQLVSGRLDLAEKTVREAMKVRPVFIGFCETVTIGFYDISFCEYFSYSRFHSDCPTAYQNA